jgi:hypothetical protein
MGEGRDLSGCVDASVRSRCPLKGFRRAAAHDDSQCVF